MSIFFLLATNFCYYFFFNYTISMVKLDKIYTKGGDNGKTSIGDGKRVNKYSLRIIAVGAVEELNAHIGLSMTTIGSPFKKLLADIQNDLFDLGADLIMPNNNRKPLRISSIHVIRLEKEIDSINSSLKPLKSFILPGGSVVSSQLHLARTVCRRCEINIIQLNCKITINKNALKYINRLSDLLFVLARKINIKNNTEVLWKPGKNIINKK